MSRKLTLPESFHLIRPGDWQAAKLKARIDYWFALT
jgi:hypothetical protein